MIIKIKEVKQLLAEGRKVSVRTVNNEYTNITRYVEKGILKTYEVILLNSKKIKVSADHKFFTNCGWIECKNLLVDEHKILCNDNQYYKISSIKYIGNFPIVDITVDHPDHSYFGNDMLHHNSGKSLICQHLIAETQKIGGIGVYIDTENAYNVDFAKAIGVDNKKMVYVSMSLLEDIFDTIEKIIEKIRAADSTKEKKPVTIILDSIAGAIDEKENDADFAKAGYNTGKAIILGKAMRKLTQLIAREKILLVITNQLRTNLSAMAFADPYCVDPNSTTINIRYKSLFDNEYIYESGTIQELADSYFDEIDYNDEYEIDMDGDGIDILGYNFETKQNEFHPIDKFIIKGKLDHYYTNGILKCSGNHVLLDEENNELLAKDHPDYTLVNEPINIVDFSIANIHNYYANGILSHNTTPGGKAIPFHASCRIRLRKAGQIKATINGIEQAIGIKTSAEIKKNRFGPPLRKCEFNIYFDSGIDNYGSWLIQLKNYGIVKTAGAWYTIIDQNGEPIKFQSKDWLRIIESNPGLKELAYKQLCDKLVMHYNTRGIGIDDVITDTNGIDNDLLDTKIPELDEDLLDD